MKVLNLYIKMTNEEKKIVHEIIKLLNEGTLPVTRTNRQNSVVNKFCFLEDIHENVSKLSLTTWTRCECSRDHANTM